ncbi:MAG: O-methyltransferase [Acidimicrobiales bacterium]
MSDQETKSILVTKAVHDYAVAHGTPPDEVQESLIATTAALGGVSRMQIAPEQGTFMTLLAKLVDARFAVEVGTFTGYSSLCIARGLAPGGRLLCCDVSEEWTAVARAHWAQAGVDDRIDLVIAPAADTLRALPTDPPIDLAFIDADKTGYRTYYDLIVERMRPGGVVLVDNVLWSGNVVDDSDQSDDTVALRAVNDHIAADDRMDVVMLPIADGLTIARKR